MNIKKLYKYRAINKFTYSDLINNTIHLSFPKDFNDPFDSAFNIKVEGTREEIVNYYCRNNAREEVEKIIASNELPKEYISNEHSDLRVFCLSENNSDVLLWSHYADSHKGICISYNIEQKNKQYKMKINPIGEIEGNELDLHKIRYKDKYPSIINLITPNRTEAEKYLKRKARKWRYEQEWRILLWNDIKDSDSIYLDENVLEGIVFGWKTPAKDVETVIRIFDEKDSQRIINYYKAVPRKDEISLDVTVIEDIEEFIKYRNRNIKYHTFL